MKSTILYASLFCLSLAKGLNAQEKNLLAYHTNFNVEKAIVKRHKSNHYWKEVGPMSHSNQVSSLQQRIARFDITQLDEYDANEPSTYTVVFRENNSSIYAKYNALGNLMSTIERHKNVKVPQPIGREIAIRYPGWSFKNSMLIIKYRKKGKINIAFKVQILNGSKKRVLKLPV